MLTEAEAQQFAAEWIAAWNSHNLDAMLSHYAADVVLTSPAAAKLFDEPSGAVTGKEALRRYFSRGLEAYRNLSFELLDVLWGISSIVLYFKNQRGTKTAEVMELDSNRKVTRVVANYSA
ncbi:MAG: nuclear transport factor 2 family protein [Acidobacteriaceae bacterium]